MEFTIDSEMLKNLLNIMGRVIPGNPAVPILSGILLEADRNHLILTGGDLNISIVKKIDLHATESGEITEAGRLVVPMKYFHELIKKMPNKTMITIKKLNQKIKVINGEIEMTLSGMNQEEYPAIPEMPDNGGGKVKGSLLIDMIKETQFAASKSDSRPVLTGLNWVFSENQLTMTATNSQRMAMRKTSLTTLVSGSYIFPIKAMTELIQVIDKHQFIQINPSDNLVVFQSEDLMFFTKLISGNYPDIEKIIPEEMVTEVVVNRSKLLQGIERANLLASQWKHNNVLFSFTEEGKIQLSSSTSEVGQITEKLVPLELKGDTQLQISFDGRFFAEALKSMKDELVSLRFGGSLRPILILPYNKKSTIHLISPVRAS
ncbi:DNA polymerase III subunit beta [Bacillus salacetis]|uniref:Beta sliding clamp n=1 Tax=Bacillus salacetis TaxID=2315464 RepID=A0A3A1R6M3_9BACI|nr:DNA polymerase III subunit beta [Bacillus salacetis]RIW38488.1 DNA polymerase III subunit beta [Bacillus salacetis]